jgi:acetyl-CoA carboxylase biotin carboxyl carrier protein
MELDEIRQILELMREHELVEFELEREQTRLRLRKQGPADAVAGQALPALAAAPAVTLHAPVPAAAPEAAAVLTSAGDDLGLVIVKAPIVGTFYRAPEPGAPSFVETGQAVRRGQVLCIIEAMKLMNEINAECEGEVVSVFVENGQPVQYGERLFAIRPR